MNRLLFPTDFSDVSKQAYQYTKAFAGHLGAEISVMHTYQPTYSWRNILQMRNTSRQYYRKLEEFSREENGRVPPYVSLMLRRGKPEEQIPLVSEKTDYRYIVMAKKNAYQAFLKILGSKTTIVSANSKAPVLVLPSKMEYRSIRNILVVGGEYRLLDKTVQSHVLSLSLLFNANLHYINVNSDPVTWQYNKEILHRNNFLIQKSIPEEYAVESLFDYSHEHQMDLMVMLPKQQRLFEDLFRHGYLRYQLDKVDIPLLVFHSNYLNWMKESEKKDQIQEHSAPIL